MKKIFNFKFILKICFLFILVMSFISLKNTYMMYLDNEKNIEEKEKITNSNVYFKQSFLDMGDGWIYYLSNTKVGNNTNYYYFNGCNLKYRTLKDNYILSDTNVSDSGKNYQSPPQLFSSYKSKDGKTFEKDEYSFINNFISIKNWDMEISEKNFSKLDLINFKKKDLVKLWNDMYNESYISEYGEYEAYQECEIRKEDNNKNYFQVSFSVSYGYLNIVKIDYVNEDGKYLSDLYENNKLTSKEKEIYKNIKLIEEEILKDKNFYLKDKFNELRSDDDYKNLFNLFLEIEENKKY